jgi:hypothetical protein
MKTKCIFLGMIFLAALFSSCEKDEQSSPIEINLTKTATLKGLMRADLNLTNQVLEFVLIHSVNYIFSIFEQGFTFARAKVCAVG